MPNYYQILNVLPSSSDRDIRIAYRKLALKHHPDKNQSANPEAFHAIQNAYEILSNEARRKEFDSLLSASQNNDLNAFF